MMTDEWTYRDEATEFDEAEHDPRGRARADVTIGKVPKSSLAVRFDADDLERLRQIADRQGVGVTQLVRQWVEERLDDYDGGAEGDRLVRMLETALGQARALTS